MEKAVELLENIIQLINDYPECFNDNMNSDLYIMLTEVIRLIKEG